MAKARDLSSSSVFSSLKAAGNIFNDTAKKMMAKRPTQSDNFLSLEPNDVIIFPLYLRYGYNKVYGSFVLGYVLKGGKTASAEIHQIFPSTIKRTLWPVEKDEETGEWQRVRDVNPTNTGTAVEFANKFGNFSEVFENLAGKGIKVVEANEHTVLRFRSKDETRQASVYQLDLIENLEDKYKEFLEQEVFDKMKAEGKV